MSTANPTDTGAPRVWLACLTCCYNDGALVGRWVDCTDVEGVTLADLHEGSGRPYAACEEVWVLDHEFVPVEGEFGPLEAAQWGECFEEAGPEQWPAVCAWVRSGMHITEGSGDLPSLPDFEERYCGHWESFREYAEQLADETGMMTDWPEEAVRYFDWASWTRDLAFDHTVVDAPAVEGYGVYVFRNL
ncbi:antirestriction protein ArdA [Propioniciclava soli]|uniref:Antirestriction protein ArdA n=1 Tax=Propioniciclava soli TaxID=2775081 RepID=A0ABZ3C521_9ACTN